MKLRVFKSLGVLNAGLEKIKPRLPASFANAFYAPIPGKIREPSLLEDLERESEVHPLPASYTVDPRLLAEYPPVKCLRRRVGTGSRVLTIPNATVLPGGIILDHKAIHRASSVYRRLNPDQFLKSAQTYFSLSKDRPEIPEATLVSRQLNEKGTWGDYFLEFLLPLSWVAGLPKTVLCDCGYVSKYAPGDSKDLNFECLNIPPAGIQVERLEVVGPCQSFNNFEPENIEKIREALPAEYQNPGSKIYLSRHGVESENPKQQRSIKNEKEIEMFLENRGFRILRAHEIPPKQLRNRLSGAEVIVGARGAAMLNILWARPRAIVELASESSWGPTVLKMAAAMGTSQCEILRTTDHNIPLEELSAALEKINV